MQNTKHTTSRIGGLYLNGELVTHSDVKELARKKGTTPAQLHAGLIAGAKLRQDKAQGKKTSAQHFNDIADILRASEKFYGFPMGYYNQLAGAILTAADKLQITFEKNLRGQISMLCADGVAGVKLYDKPSELAAIFEGLIEASGVSVERLQTDSNVNRTGINLADHFKALI